MYLSFRRILFPMVGVMAGLSVGMFVSLIVAMIFKDGNQSLFFNLTVFTFGVAGILWIISGETSLKLSKYSWSIFLILAINIFGLIGALPFYLALGEMSFINAWFESISGFTSTGSTILRIPEALPPSIEIWRSISQWIGSAFFILVACLLFPVFNIGGFNITGRNIIHQSSQYRMFYSIFSLPLLAFRVLFFYFIITALCILAYMISGLTLWQSINLALTTISHGGFVNSSDSFIKVQNYSVIYTTILFMILASIPTGLTLNLCLKNIVKEQYKGFLLIILVSTLIVFLFYGIFEQNIHKSFTDSLFTVVSFMTGTGFRINNYNYWPIYFVIIIICLTIIGGCSKTPNSGVKVFRIVLAVKMFIQHIRLLVETQRNLFITYDKNYLTLSSLIYVSAYLIVFLITTLFLITLLLFFNAELDQAVGGIIATITNSGPNLFDTKEVSNYFHYSTVAKFILGWSMIIGRFEIIPVFILLLKFNKNV